MIFSESKDEMSERIRNIQPKQKIIYAVAKTGFCMDLLSSQAKKNLISHKDNETAHFLQKRLNDSGEFQYYIVGK